MKERKGAEKKGGDRRRHCCPSEVILKAGCRWRSALGEVEIGAVWTRPSCAQCHNFPEDSLHAIWSCEAISGVWSTLEWLRQTAPPHPSSFSELLVCFLSSREEFRAELFVIIVWFLWNRRNAIHFGRPPLPVDSICSKAGNYLQEFLEAQTEEPVPPRPPPLQQWRPPDPHCLKINFDAAVFRQSSLASVGVVVRNNVGEVEGAMSSPIPMAQAVADLEALACLKAVLFALELGITRVVFEVDSAVVINALLHGAGAFASFGNILDDIRVLFAAFQFVVFTFVSRCCNSVADALAKKAKFLDGAQVWLHDVPADIAPLVLRDVH
ncbi:hypothetical protein SO802_027910 [Lithocarpus litseifolius]|uniref:RNase H type-1 domain-containing protein n=1 Tax=Lithocarpus litseifolius TaxID=425828 RepID=A0AAW2BQU6_9ROSI